MSNNWQVCKSFPFQLCTKAPPNLILPSLFLNSSPDHLQFISLSPGCQALLCCVVFHETHDDASWLASSHSNYGTSVIVMGSTSTQEGDRPSSTRAFAVFGLLLKKREGLYCLWLIIILFLKNLIKTCFKTVLVESVQPLDDDAHLGNFRVSTVAEL